MLGLVPTSVYAHAQLLCNIHTASSQPWRKISNRPLYSNHPSNCNRSTMELKCLATAVPIRGNTVPVYVCNAKAVSIDGGTDTHDGKYTGGRGRVQTTKGDVSLSLGPITPTADQPPIENPVPSRLSLAPKLMQKILKLKSIESGELVPESFVTVPEHELCNHHSHSQSHQDLVTRCNYYTIKFRCACSAKSGDSMTEDANFKLHKAFLATV